MRMPGVRQLAVFKDDIRAVMIERRKPVKVKSAVRLSKLRRARVIRHVVRIQNPYPFEYCLDYLCQVLMACKLSRFFAHRYANRHTYLSAFRTNCWDDNKESIGKKKDAQSARFAYDDPREPVLADEDSRANVGHGHPSRYLSFNWDLPTFQRISNSTKARTFILVLASDRVR
jgi:hypothetical protein